jgi:hypothetical protein
LAGGWSSRCRCRPSGAATRFGISSRHPGRRPLA